MPHFKSSLLNSNKSFVHVLEIVFVQNMLQPKILGGGRVLLGEVFWVVFNELLGGRLERFCSLQGYCNAAAKVLDVFF